MKHSKAVLLVNLGSPDSYDPKDVKRYLDEFLMDERVIDLPKFLRTLIVRGIILNTRPKKSAALYKEIWWDEGSPLLVLSERLLKGVDEKTPYPVGLAMRYGNPSIHDAIEKLKNENPYLKEIFVVPLYPHYAMSSYETVVVKVKEVVNEFFPYLSLSFKEPFYNQQAYIDCLAASIKPYLKEAYDHILFSYHGIPERHLRKTDPTKKHCLKVENCCEVPNEEAHACCYRHQCLTTTALVAEQLQIPKDKFSFSFQSRLGPDPWLKPYTDKTIESLPEKGVKNLLVVCPAFVSDCLETLEEIANRKSVV